MNSTGDDKGHEFEEGDKVSDPETNADGDPSQQLSVQRVPKVCSEKKEEIHSTEGGCEAGERPIVASSDPDSPNAKLNHGQNAENVLKRGASAEGMLPPGTSEVCTKRTSSSSLNYSEET